MLVVVASLSLWILCSIRWIAGFACVWMSRWCKTMLLLNVFFSLLYISLTILKQLRHKGSMPSKILRYFFALLIWWFSESRSFIRKKICYAKKRLLDAQLCLRLKLIYHFDSGASKFNIKFENMKKLENEMRFGDGKSRRHICLHLQVNR